MGAAEIKTKHATVMPCWYMSGALVWMLGAMVWMLGALVWMLGVMVWMQGAMVWMLRKLTTLTLCLCETILLLQVGAGQAGAC